MRLSKYYPLPPFKKDVMIKVESKHFLLKEKFE